MSQLINDQSPTKDTPLCNAGVFIGCVSELIRPYCTIREVPDTHVFTVMNKVKTKIMQNNSKIGSYLQAIL